MQGLERELTTLTMDVGETSTEKRIQRMISENPVIIFSKTSCLMCHVMKSLFATLGVHPTVIELDEGEMEKARPALGAHNSRADYGAPAVFIGGAHVGGLESLVALHLSGSLLPKLREVGALWL
ncbi:glutaredoxin-C6-like [Tasmannia lanceolata]|uniref:glutaredoxin-C6-like n=1 Tax=Tasmannia lanceolata TaxID=3420 RepID=UPI0040648E5B